jgi:Tfp pilus assembly protein PilF
LLMRAGRPDDARRAFDTVLAAQPVPWARLGVARAQLRAGHMAEALHTLQQLVAQQADFADAHDVLARAQIELGQFDAALESLRLAAAITPGSVTRQQRLGMLAFQLGQHDEATAALERAVAAGAGSKVFDPLVVLLLAVLRYGQRDRKGLQRCQDELNFALERQADDARLQRLAATAAIFGEMMHRRLGEVVERIQALAAGIDQDGFDLEAACGLLMVVTTLGTDELRLQDSGVWIERIGMRHAGSKAQAEWLACAARASPPHARAMHDCHARVLELAEEALSLSLAGNPRGAVLALIGHALRTMNPKLIDTAAAVLQRHRGAVDGADELGDRVEALRRRWGRHDGRVRVGRAPARESGELVLRVAAPRAARSGPALAKVA